METRTPIERMQLLRGRLYKAQDILSLGKKMMAALARISESAGIVAEVADESTIRRLDEFRDKRLRNSRCLRPALHDFAV